MTTALPASAQIEESYCRALASALRILEVYSMLAIYPRTRPKAQKTHTHPQTVFVRTLFTPHAQEGLACADYTETMLKLLNSADGSVQVALRRWLRASSSVQVGSAQLTSTDSGQVPL